MKMTVKHSDFGEKSREMRKWLNNKRHDGCESEYSVLTANFFMLLYSSLTVKHLENCTRKHLYISIAVQPYIINIS